MKFLLVCVVGLLACVHAYVDESMVEKAKGNKVVEVSLKRLHKSCIFGDDKFFMRLLAFVESKDGNDAKTYRPNFYGGIWQVIQLVFNFALNTLPTFSTIIPYSYKKKNSIAAKECLTQFLIW